MNGRECKEENEEEALLAKRNGKKFYIFGVLTYILFVNADL